MTDKFPAIPAALHHWLTPLQDTHPALLQSGPTLSTQLPAPVSHISLVMLAWPTFIEWLYAKTLCDSLAWPPLAQR